MNQYNYINFNKLLIDNFKELNIDEIDAFLLMTIDQLKRQNGIVTPENLKDRLRISEKEIDARLATLLNKKYLSFSEEGRNFTLSVSALIDQLLNRNDKKKKKVENEIYSLLEKELGRALSSVEVQIVNDWQEQNYSKEDIVGAWCIAVSNEKATIQYADGILRKTYGSKAVIK